jgi:hypothetical protein
VREESHLEEMRSAIRGDFERLAERRGEQELMRVAEPGPEPESDPEEPLVETEPPQEHVPEPESELEPGRSWLARFFSP